jgi:histidine triad (HIT) family protein
VNGTVAAPASGAGMQLQRTVRPRTVVCDACRVSGTCLVCSEVSGDVPIPGGHLEDSQLVSVFHRPLLAPAIDVYMGYLFVTTKRHVPGFAGLGSAEAAAVGVAIARWSRALESAGAEHVYVLRIGFNVPHLHVHLVPRWPGTPGDVAWIHVDDWPGARRGDAAQAAEVVAGLRRLEDATLHPES